MVEYNAELMSDKELIEAANMVFSAQEKDFEKIKTEKWYQTFFHAITLNQDGTKYAVRGIKSLAKLQQLFMNVYVKNYRKSHEQLDAVIDAVTKNSEAIKRLYAICVLNLEEQIALEQLEDYDGEILALFLGEYRDESGNVPSKVQDYNRGVLLALNKKVPSGSLDNHQISKLKAPKVVYRCFMEQCAVDGTIDNQEWPDKIYQDIDDFELSNNSKKEIKDSVKREVEMAGVDYLLVKYTKNNSGVLDTDFLIDLEGDLDSSKEQSSTLVKKNEHLLYMAAGKFLMALYDGSRRLSTIYPPLSGDGCITLDCLSDKEILNDDEINNCSFDLLKDSVKSSLKKEKGFIYGCKIVKRNEYYEAEGKESYFAILTTEYLFVIFDEIVVIPIFDLRSVKETESGLVIEAQNIYIYSSSGELLDTWSEIEIYRKEECTWCYRALRKALDCFLVELNGYAPLLENEITRIIDENIGSISKSSPVYMVRDIDYNDEKSRKKLKNALAKYAQKVQEGNVIGFIDTSFLGNGGDGLLFSKDGIAFVCGFEKIFVHYEEIDYLSFDSKGKSLRLNGSFTERKDDSSTPEIADIYFDLDVLKRCLEEICYIV